MRIAVPSLCALFTVIKTMCTVLETIFSLPPPPPPPSSPSPSPSSSPSSSSSSSSSSSHLYTAIPYHHFRYDVMPDL